MCNSSGTGISSVKSTVSLETRFPYRALASDKYFAIGLLTPMRKFSSQAHAADFVTVASPTVTATRDAVYGATPSIFYIPAGTTHIKVAGLGDSDNSAINFSDEECQMISFVIGLDAVTRIRIVM